MNQSTKHGRAKGGSRSMRWATGDSSLDRGSSSANSQQQSSEGVARVYALSYTGRR